MTREEIEQIIAQNIKTNGRGEITAQVMAGVLNSFISYTDSLTEDYTALVNTLSDAFTVLVEQMEGDVETKMTALETAFEEFTTDLLENHFEPWANDLATALQGKMDDVKAAALAAKTAAEGADTKAGDAKAAALQAKTASETASGKADDAKTAALAAKEASLDASSKAGDAKAAAQDAAGKATDAKAAAVDASTKATQAKASSDVASSKAGEAKTAALAAKTAIQNTEDGLDEALEIIRKGNSEGGSVKLPNGVKFAHVEVTELPAGLDFSQVTYGDELFAESALTVLPSGLNLTSANRMCAGCYSLETISGLTITSTDEMAALEAFDWCDYLTNVSDVHFDVPAISFKECYQLTVASLTAIVDGLAAGDGTRTLEVHADSYALMESNGLIAAATAKGWTVVSAS